MIWIGLAFFATIIVIEIVCGIAVFGFTGGNPIVERAESPGQFWFSIALQALFGLVLPVVIIFSGVF